MLSREDRFGGVLREPCRTSAGDSTFISGTATLQDCAPGVKCLRTVLLFHCVVHSGIRNVGDGRCRSAMG